MATRRPGRFMVLGRERWRRVSSLKGPDHLDLMVSYLLLLAGTDRGHRFTTWSVNAISLKAGMNKYRVKKLIDRLKAEGLVLPEPAPLPGRSTYELAAFDEPPDAIFLPMELVQGASDETPVLRRLREAEDPFPLVLLIDLYGWVGTEMAYAVRPDLVRMVSGDPAVQEMVHGPLSVWALPPPDTSIWKVDASRYTAVKKATREAKQRAFLNCLQALLHLHVIYGEAWVCSRPHDPEPLFPWTPNIEALAGEVARKLINSAWPGRPTPLPLVPLPAHMKSAALIRLVKLQVEPDTELRRAAFARRHEAEAWWTRQFEELEARVDQGDFSTPIRSFPRPQEGDRTLQGPQ